MPTEALFRADAYLKACEAVVSAVTEAGVELDRTVFYPMGGGQPGDTGVLRAGELVLHVTDTRKGPARGRIVHTVGEGHGLTVGDRVTAEIDWDRRHRHMRMHTTLHLLCSLVDGAVTGGALTAEKGRLDFDLPDPSLDKQALTDGLARLVAEDHVVRTVWITDDEMAARPELVRTMSVRPPTGAGRVRLLEIVGVDLQPCGGTHVARTGEIGAVRVKKIENKGAKNRRVRVVFDA